MWMKKGWWVSLDRLSWSRTLQNVLSLLFPLHCVACQASGALFCATCLAAVQPIAEPLCQRCGLPLRDRFCGYCHLLPPAVGRLTGQRSVGLYLQPFSTCIQAFKYRQQTSLAPLLGNLLARAYQHYQLHADLIIPVPLHYERERQRGYNQATLIASVCAQQLMLPLDTTGLRRTRATPAQAMLKAEQRYLNVLGAFHYQASFATLNVRNRSILIIDDVSTTGSTLAACADPLWQAGAREVWGLVLARPLKPLAFF